MCVTTEIAAGIDSKMIVFNEYKFVPILRVIYAM